MLLALAATAAGLAGGCRSEPAAVKHQVAMSGHVVAMQVEEARADSDEVFIRFQGALADTLQLAHRPWFYVTAETDEEDDLVTAARFDTEEGWAARTAAAAEVPVLDREIVDAVALEVMRAIVPEAPGEGAVVRVDLEQVVVHLDETGEMDAVLLTEKPAHIRVVATYPPAEVRPK